MTENSIALALIAIVGGVITSLFKLLNNNTKALNKNVQAHLTVAKEIKKGNREAKERNGHLGEMATKQAEFTKESTNQILKAVQSIPKQNVQEQNVEHQTVKSKE